MNLPGNLLKGSALATLLIGAPGLADDQRFDFDFNAGIGAAYDSNVALLELDSNAGEADAATELEAGLGMTARIGGDFRLKAGYDYSATRYRRFSDFDLAMHHGHVSLTMRKGPVDSAVAVDRFEAVLSGQEYLTQTQVSPSISRLFVGRWYLRGAVTRADKSFSALDERDATSDALRIDAYLLLDGMQHYVAISAQVLNEDAVAAAYDYESAMGQLGWGYRFDRPAADIDLKVQLRYERREYGGVILESGRTRVDERIRAGLEVAIPFSEHVSVTASVEHTRNTSGIVDANVDRVVYAMEFGVAF